MSIEQAGIVDFISINEGASEVVLTISDHLEWSADNKEHLFLLQEKINSYLRFIESGELMESYPKANGRGVVINIIGKFPLDEEAEKFIDNVRAIVGDAGIVLRFEEFKDV